MTVPPPPHEPSPYGQSAQPGGASPHGQPSPAGDYGQPSPAGSYGQPSAADPYGQASPAAAYGQPSPAGAYGQPAPAGQAGQPGPSQDAAWGLQDGQVGSGVPAPGQDLGADLGAALKFAGNGLLRNWVPFLVVGLIYGVIACVIIVGGVVGGIFATLPLINDVGPTDELPAEAVLIFYGISLGAGLLTAPFALLWQSGSVRAAEVILEGGRPSIGQALIGPLRVILTALLVGVITLIGTVLLVIPGLIATVLLIFAIPAAARGASPIAAIKESFTLVKNNLGTSIIMYILINAIGTVVAFFFPLVIALVPFVILFEIAMYERLNRRELPEPAKA
ncbi:hypothetical protein [Brachybacterium tyrofermentans]|uniref:Glycerophosphoryl diester phosphodiesterase membrane domain-containing protein n=1 Tax=Brachybacterium tyrofermentans TaxID=47848 RepID=A0ABW0FIN6_9MICO